MSTIPTGPITSVFFEKEDGSIIKIADGISNEKILRLCGKAVRQEKIGTWAKFVNKHPNAMLLRHHETHYQSALKIIQWIKGYDFTQSIKSQTMTRDLIGGSEDFHEVCLLYSSIISLNIARDLRGQEIRDDIFHYLKMGPLTANEFAMVYECCTWDTGITTAIMRAFHYDCQKGGKHAYPADQVLEIEAYCKEVGIWEDMQQHAEFQRERVEAEASENHKRQGVVLEELGQAGSAEVPTGPRSTRGRGGRGSRGGRGGYNGARFPRDG